MKSRLGGTTRPRVKDNCYETSLFQLLEDSADQFPIGLFAEVLHDDAHRLHFVFILRKINVFLNPGNDLFAVAILGR